MNETDYQSLGFKEVKDTEPVPGTSFRLVQEEPPVPGTSFKQVEVEPPPAPTVEEFGGTEFSRGVARASLGAGSAGLHFARIFSESPRLKELADQLADEAKMIPTKAGSIKDVLNDPSLAPAYIARVVGELAPQAVLSYLTAGTGAAIGGAAGLGATGIRVATGAGAAATSIPQEVGSMFAETEERTGERHPGIALAYGIPSGMLDALSAERIIGKVFRIPEEEARKKAWRQIVRETIKEIPKTATVEATTESMQEGLALLADKSADKTFSLLTPENGWRVLESAVAGAIGGGVLGGGQELVQLPVQRAARNQRAGELRLVRQVRDAVRTVERKDTGQPESEINPPIEPAPVEEPAIPPSFTEVKEPENPERGFVRSVRFPEADSGTTTAQADDDKTLIDQLISTERSKRSQLAIPDEVPERVMVHGPMDDNGTTVPGYVSIQARNNRFSGDQNYWKQRGFAVPDFSALPTGTYSYGEAVAKLQEQQNDQKERQQVRPLQPPGQEVIQADQQTQSTEAAPASRVLEEAQPLTVQSSVGETFAGPNGVTALVHRGTTGGSQRPFRITFLRGETPIDHQDFTGKESVYEYLTSGAYPGNWKRLNETPPSSPIAPPVEVAPKEQTQSVPANDQGVRTTTVATAEPGQVRIANTAVAKSPEEEDVPLRHVVQLRFDPLISGKGKGRGQVEAGVREGVIAISPNAYNKDYLVIQSRTSPGKPSFVVWRAPLRDLEQAGIITKTGPSSYLLNEPKLYASPLLQKSGNRNFGAYKLPTEVVTRSTGGDVQEVVDLVTKANPFAGKILQGFGPSLSLNLLRNLAVTRSGRANYAPKKSDTIADLIPAALQRLFKSESQHQPPSVANGLLSAARMISGETEGAAVGAAAVAQFITQLKDFDQWNKPPQEVSIEGESDQGGQTEGDPGQVIQQRAAIQAQQDRGRWSEAQVDALLGRVEEEHPEIFKAFAADPLDDKAWEKIEEQLTKVLNGDRAAAEVLAEEVRQRRLERGLLSPREEGDEFTEHEYTTGLNATGKNAIQSLLENRNVPLDPELRRTGLALLSRVDAKYLKDLTFNVAVDGSLEGEFIPWLKVARIAMNARPETAAHEIAHYLASFLSEADRAVVSEARTRQISFAANDPRTSGIAEWVKTKAGSGTSTEFQREGASSLHGGTLYHLINDDEYFAHYLSKAAARAPKEMEGLIGKVREIIRQIITAIKAWAGNRDARFDQLLDRFNRGDFDVNAQGGMLFELNNRQKPKSLPPISSLTELQKYSNVDQGVDEKRMIDTLAYEQNLPVVGHIIDELGKLTLRVRSELTGLTSRAEVFSKSKAEKRDEKTPLHNYAVLVNSLAVKEEAHKLADEIDRIVTEIKNLNARGDKVSAAEAQAKALEESAKNAISDYKNLLLSEQRRSRNEGVAEGLAEAIKKLDEIQRSTATLERTIDFASELFSLEELNKPGLTTQETVDQLKEKIKNFTGVADWQQATIPGGDGKPGISNEQLRIAVRIMQARQGLVQDLITYKQLSDPEFNKIMTTGEADISKQIGSLTYKDLRSFLKTYYNARSRKDVARSVYLKHRSALRGRIDTLTDKLEAEAFLHDKVLSSTQFRSAVEEATKQGSFLSADLVRDGNGNQSLKRIYHNPLNREETIEIIDGTTREDFLRNADLYDKVATWLEDGMDNPNVDPLDYAAMDLELSRIYNEEMGPDGTPNSAYDPKSGKRLPGPFNVPNMLSNLVGQTLQTTLSRISGRAATQLAAVMQARSEARRRVGEVRHDLIYPMNKAVLEASLDHEMTRAQWRTQVANPVLASYNSLGARQLKAGDLTEHGVKITGKDMQAFHAMKKFSDAMISAVRDMELHTAKLHPINIKEYVNGKQILRPAQGHNELIMPRRFDKPAVKLAEAWVKTANSRTVKDAAADLAGFISTGDPFRTLLLSHIYSTQKYPDYVGTTRYGSAYRSIYRDIASGNAPSSFAEAVDRVFKDQSGKDVPQQQTKNEIALEILNEVNGVARRVVEPPDTTRPADTTGSTVSIQSADNFMTKPRGKMVAPDSFYDYSIIDGPDVRWVTRSVLEVHEQMAREGLEKIQKLLSDYVTEWEDRAKHPDAQKESRQKQLSGEDWMNYRESKQLLNQVRRHLDRTSAKAFDAFVDEQFGGVARKGWNILIQSLLQSATVLTNNFLGMDLRLAQMDAQWRGDGLWMGMPRWLLELPAVAKNSIAWPARDIASFIFKSGDYKKARTKFSEEQLRNITNNAELAKAATEGVSMAILKRAINLQRMRDLGATGSYGLKQQIERYITMNEFGGDFEVADPNKKEKLLGRLKSLLGLIEETGGGLMLPKALAPRKLEQMLNFTAIRHAYRLIEELKLNIDEANSDRKKLGISGRITDQELLGDAKAKEGDASYMRNLFNRAGLSLDGLMERAKNNPENPLLYPAELNSFVLEVAKELNMPAADNRVQYRGNFGRLMSSLMGYGFWYNERLAESMAADSRKKIDPAAIYRTLFFLGAIASMGIFVGTPLKRLIKRLFYKEEDQTGHFSLDNTAWRNAGILWEQTAPFWPFIASVMNQLYDARSGSKTFNFLPVSVAQTALGAANEIGQTGNVFYPLMKVMRSWLPNTKIAINRLPWMDGATDVNNAARIFWSTAAGDIETRKPQPGGIKYTPASTEIQLAVNEMAKDAPNWNAIDHYRANGVREYMKGGASLKDAQERFDRAVLARVPQSTVFGRPLTTEERAKTFSRMTPSQRVMVNRVEESFGRYATHYGHKPVALVKVTKKTSGRGLGRVSGRRVSRARLTRSRSLLRRNRRLTRRAG